ncbi:putative MFS-type transporter C1399.02-like protein 2 [Colletotrichum chlorophyti]|uniref:Putative MFS-type transporter C1399.02-like protein 2 n=1 Tax=Colletotrichum chlorophyti TaxID=708187 RepID=A0A1Q8RXR5_9PEZI|nr:putative MFS-type transporter C1399.02-like protein 2 [Colletotrichum chlorophyti]
MTCVIVVAWLVFLNSSIAATYGSAYHVAHAALQPLTGKVYRYCSSKWSSFAFLVVFEIGFLICGAAPSFMVLIGGRVVAGEGSAGIVSCGLTIIAGSVPMEKRPVAHSGSMLGPMLGGVITQYRTWRWTFYTNFPIGGSVLLLLSWCNVPDQFAKPSPVSAILELHKCLDFDWLVLCAGAAVLFILGLELGGNDYAFDSASVINLFCGSVASLVAFLVWNYRKRDDGLIPRSMAGKRPVWCAAATSFTVVGSAMVQIYLLPIYFQTVQGATPAQSGVNVLPNIMFPLAFPPVSVGRLGYYLCWAVGRTAVTVVAGGLLTTLTPTTPVVKWAVPDTRGTGAWCSTTGKGLARPLSTLGELTSS